MRRFESRLVLGSVITGLMLAVAGCANHAQTGAASAAAMAPAATEEYAAALTGPNENPPVASNGTGAGVISFAPANNELSWTINYDGLTGPATAAHFHGPAPVGQNAGVMVPITVGPSPLVGSATLTPDQVAALRGGLMYVNIHTGAHPDGEIRGQVTAAAP